jgi:hypothetical protein
MAEMLAVGKVVAVGIPGFRGWEDHVVCAVGGWWANEDEVDGSRRYVLCTCWEID